MRRGKAHRKFASMPSPFKIKSSRNDERNVWVVNDDGHPRSPLSIERLQHVPRGQAFNVARVKPTCKLLPMAHRKKEMLPGGEFPFFIDKTPSKELNESITIERCFNQNDSIVIMDSPSVSSVAKESTSGKAVPPLRHLSVDTVDLISDNEEEHINAVNSRKRKKDVESRDTKRRRFMQKSTDICQPDIIILDDEDEPASELCDNSLSVVEESVHLNSLSKPQQELSVTCTISGSAEYLPISSKGNGKGLNNNSELPCLNPFSYPPLSTSNGPFARAGPSTRRKTHVRPLKSHVPNLCGSHTVSSMPNAASLEDVSSPSGVHNEGPSTSALPMDVVGSNVFNPYGNMEQTGLRPIIIDGCNVAIGHGGNRTFSVRGLCICVEYFLRRGHPQVVALVPLHHRCKVSPQDREVLESLLNDEHLVYTPSRFIDNRLISSYDDRFIVQYAAAVGGVIVSRDNYKDLLIENPAWRDTITNRLLMPTWVGDMLMFPVDPMGKKGPTLDEFLRFPNK